MNPLDPHTLIDQRREEIFADYAELLRIPSISALSAHNADTQRAARFVAEMLRHQGLEHIDVIQTAGAPLVYADWMRAPGKPTLLIYAHYDVQPIDPAREWTTPPFEPTVKGDVIYGRGVTDDKNNLTGTIHAVGAILAARGTLPLNIRFLLEGEEESGGEAVEHFVRTQPERIASDIVMVADGGMYPDQPTLCYGCRGILYTEIVVHGPQRDLHSGGYGGVAPNPIFALAEILTQLKDSQGHIQIPGLYDLMTPISARERALWQTIDRDFEGEYRAQIGTEVLTGETEYGVIERNWARPTLEVHGIIGGFQDEGSKTVIPASARAKVSLRLVPGQTPENVLPLLRARVAAVTPAGIKASVEMIHGGLPFYTDVTSPVFTTAMAALSEEFGKPAWAVRSGGSIPISAIFQEKLGADVFCIGFGQSSDGAHSPNEHTSISTFYRGVHALARVIDALGAIPAV